MQAEDSEGRRIEVVLSLPDQCYLDMLEPAYNDNPILHRISQQYPQLEYSHGRRHSEAFLTLGYPDHNHFFRPTCALRLGVGAS